MKVFDPRQFWLNIDNILYLRNMLIKDLCQKIDVPYNTLIIQRNRHSMPKTEQVALMAEALNVSIDQLIYGKSAQPALPKRIQTIVDACLNATDEDLMLVERVLDIKKSNDDSISQVQKREA